MVCDCGNPGAARPRSTDPICDRCWSIDPHTPVESEIMLALLGGPSSADSIHHFSVRNGAGHQATRRALDRMRIAGRVRVRYTDGDLLPEWQLAR